MRLAWGFFMSITVFSKGFFHFVRYLDFKQCPNRLLLYGRTFIFFIRYFQEDRHSVQLIKIYDLLVRVFSSKLYVVVRYSILENQQENLQNFRMPSYPERHNSQYDLESFKMLRKIQREFGN
jgi:hypothetical protein